MTHTEPDPHKVHLACSDGIGRERSIGLWAVPTSGRLVLVAPPAEAALLTPKQARSLRDQLDALATVVENEHAAIIKATLGIKR